MRKFVLHLHAVGVLVLALAFHHDPRAQSAAAPAASAPSLGKVPCAAIKGESITDSLWEAIKAPFSLSDKTCTSMRAFLHDVSRSEAGRDLMKAVPFDPKSATKQLTDAESDTEFQQALADELEGESDPVRRTLVKAALLKRKAKPDAAARTLNEAIELARRNPTGGIAK